MLKLKLIGVLGAVAASAALAFALVPAANAEPTSGCEQYVDLSLSYNTTAIDANLAHRTEDALDANQDAQGAELSALLACLGRPLQASLDLLSATLSNAQAMTANDRGPSGEGAALTGERKVDLALRAALKAIG